MECVVGFVLLSAGLPVVKLAFTRLTGLQGQLSGNKNGIQHQEEHNAPRDFGRMEEPGQAALERRFAATRTQPSITCTHTHTQL